MAVSQVLMPGLILGGEFEIVRPIGQGGMGTVYQAIQKTIGAPRAVKVMRNGLASDPRFRARFDQEARVSARIQSDHVVQVVRAGVDEQTLVPWIAMELLEGENLQSRLDRGEQIAPSEINVLLEQLFHALAAAHQVGVVHRDIKPENVFLGRPRVVGVPFMVKVLDFGVAKILSEARGATVAVGTPAYMAPEQTNTDGEVGPQADIWALGLVVFRLLAGVPYWKSLATGEGGPVHLWREVLIDPVVAASVRARELGNDKRLPEGFDDWFARCVCREVEQRFPDAEAAYSALQSLLPRISRETWLSARPGSGGHSTVPNQEGALLATALASESHVAPVVQPTAPPIVSTLKTGPKGTARVTFREKNERVVAEVTRGSTLLEASLAVGIPHHHVCGGRARCTTCRVVLLDGSSSAGPRTAQEELVANVRRWPSSIRLACQLRVLGDMSVRRLVVDDDDRDTVNASHSTEEPAVEEAVMVAILLPNFAEFSRDHLPYDVVHILNRYLRQFCELALANQGDLVRYESAGVLLSFGRGTSSAKDMADALRTALRVQARTKQLNGYTLRHFGSQFDVAVGIHAGRLLRAPLGHPSRVEQSVFGDGVDGAWAAARAAADANVSVVATDAALALPGLELRLGKPIEWRSSGKGVEVVDFARPDVHLLVQSTFERLEGRWNDFAASFYEKLFALDPAISRLFEHTDMEAQRGMLMEVLATAIRGLDRFDELVPVLRELGGRHVAYGTRVSHYKQVGGALLRTLEEFLGADFTPEVHLAWMEVYGAVAREMIAGSKAASDGG